MSKNSGVRNRCLQKAQDFEENLTLENCAVIIKSEYGPRLKQAGFNFIKLLITEMMDLYEIDFYQEDLLKTVLSLKGSYK